MPEDDPKTAAPPEEEREERQDESSEGASPGLVVRAKASLGHLVDWAKGHRLMAAIASLVVMVALSGALVLVVMLWPSGDPYSDVTLDMALEALKSRDLDQARTWAGALAKRGDLTVDEAGGPAYIFGAASFDDAEDSWTKDKRLAYLLAARYLEAARDRGFPPGYEAKGLLLLGKSLYHSDQLAAAQPALQEALETNTDKKIKNEIRFLLADTEMRDAVPKPKEALENNTEYLKYRFLSKVQRDQGLLQRAKILLQLGEIAKCVETMNSIPEESTVQAQVTVLRGRVLMREARELKAKPDATAEERAAARRRYDAAIKTLRSAQGADTLTNVATRQAMYLIGVCLIELGDTRAAVDQFQRMRTVFPDSPEAFAADVQEAELNRIQGRDEAAMAAYRRVLKGVTDPDEFNNPWFTISEIRTRVMVAYNDYQRTNHFEDALKMTRMMYPLFPRERAMELTAQTYRKWGETLVAQAAHVPPSKAAPLLKEGRLRLREAGRAYVFLAKVHIASSAYADDLWNAAESYLDGHAYSEAVRVLREYLSNESRRRNPRALVGMGEAMLALGKIDEAIASLNQCIEFHPTDASSFRARLLASQAYREIGEPDQAEKLLKDNLNGEGITPKSTVWLDSLFELGELMHETGRFSEAIRRLEEMVARLAQEPKSSRAIMARYLIADSYRRSAQAARAKLYRDLVENARMTQTREIQELLNSALKQYEAVKELLATRRETMELTPLEEQILRNCYFAIGDTLFDLGEYEEAIKAYSLIANRYQARPEVLEAYLQLYHANRRLGRPLQARRALQHARVVLQRMNKNVSFTETTNSTRQQWATLLDSLINS
ncbi:MAG: tetratricopeptide repeat protein [Pirellulales bacterium]|nr:tetratricopeptide repeat protein [Pirellulales bacterium]